MEACLFSPSREHCRHEREFMPLGGLVPEYRDICCWCGATWVHGRFVSGIEKVS